jgi:glutathione S-transferase
MVLGAEDLRSIYLGFWGPGDAARRAAFVAGPWRERWRPAFEGLLELGGDTGHFVGGRITHADIAVYDALDAVLQWVEGATLDGCPRLQAFMAAIAARPRIAAYLASERRASG